MNRTLRLVLPVLMTLILCSAALACPMCKDSIPNSDAQQAAALPNGFNNSVYAILIGFLTVLGMVIAFIVKAIRNTTARPALQVIPRDGRPRRRSKR